jgi:general secretion pathway protein E
MTGYKGRLGIYEIMTMTNGLRDLIRENANVEDLRQQSYIDGMKPLRVNGALKVAAGTTTVEEVLSVTPAPPAQLRQPPKLAAG